MVRKYFRAPALVFFAVSVPAMAQYMATPPPGQTPAAPPPARSGGLTITAKNGQTEQQQWTDRYDCHRWAKDQSGFDPTLQPPPGITPNEITSRRDQYRRAFTACLEGRGYDVHYGAPLLPRPRHRLGQYQPGGLLRHSLS